jgi:hypothetical protein
VFEVMGRLSSEVRYIVSVAGSAQSARNGMVTYRKTTRRGGDGHSVT